MVPMKSDWSELIASLRSHGVEFLIVGAHALAFHGRARYTEDLDVFLHRTAENRERTGAALAAFGIPVRAEALDRLFGEGRQMLVLGHAPFAVDLMGFLDGVEFDQAWERRCDGMVLGEAAYVIGIEDYLATKRASGRPKDLADIAILEEALRR
jgi:hypothetical protein